MTTCPDATLRPKGWGCSAVDAQARAWAACCLAWAVLSLGFHALSGGAWEWRYDLAWGEPWRWWSAAWVHFGATHLAMNLAGCGVVAALGRAARLGSLWVWAWVLAWPLSHLGLLLHEPGLAFRGLSGVLHAGVAVASVALIGAQDRRQRRWGGILAVGLALKVLWELPQPGDWALGPGGDFVVATGAHVGGVLSGWAVASALAFKARGWRAASGPRPGPTMRE